MIMTVVLLTDGVRENSTPGTATAIAESADATKITPLDLDENPAIERFLGALGCGNFDRAALTSPFGRNDVWAGPASTGAHVFVKRLRGTPDDVAARLRRLQAFEAVLAAQTSRLLAAPAYLGSDEGSGLVAYEMILGAISGAQSMVDETFDNELSRRTGEAAAAIHDLVIPAEVELDTSRPVLPCLDLVNGLPLTFFETASYGELEAWRLQQNDRPLVAALVALHERETAAERAPAHCDFRVDQLLLVGDAVLVTDWEEFRLADPARDIGGFAGEWLYRSILDIVTSRGEESFDDTALDHAAVLRRGVEKLERLRPRIQHFWLGYRSRRPLVGRDFAERAAAFAGWHMLDRLIAGSPFRGRLTGIEKAAAGIGRGILLDPGKFAPAIGLEVC
jgi:hypothetical protein